MLAEPDSSIAVRNHPQYISWAASGYIFSSMRCPISHQFVAGGASIERAPRRLRAWWGHRLLLQEAPRRQGRYVEVVALRQRLVERRRKESRDARGDERRRHHRDHHAGAVGHLHHDDEG